LMASTRGKIELNMSEDDGQEDKVLTNLIGEAIKNIFETYFEPKRFRPLVEWFEAGHTFMTGDRLPLTNFLAKIAEVPILQMEIEQFIGKHEAAFAPEANEALIVSVSEFILEGLHVENRLNKKVKRGETEFGK